MDLSRWMTDLDKSIRTLPIIYLAIPGSHDSMTFGITSSSQVAPDCEKLVRFLLKFGGSLVKKIVVKWSITQSLTVTEQLSHGIRYFDLRIAKNEEDNAFYFVHSLYSSKILDKLREILEFLECNETEIVILDFQHFYDLTPSDHCILKNMIINVFDNRICPCYSAHEITLDWMKQNLYQVIVIYRDSTCSDPRFWPSWMYPTYWPNTTSLNYLLSFLDNTVKMRNNGNGMISQCLLTPDTGFVIRNIFSNLNRACAKPCLHAVLPWIEQQHAGCSIVSNGINVVICDFIEQQDSVFCKSVINLNYELGSLMTSAK